MCCTMPFFYTGTRPDKSADLSVSAMRAAAFGTVSEVSVMYVLLFSLAGLLLAARVVRNTDLLTNELT